MSLSLGNIPIVEAITFDDFLLFSESNSRFIVEIEQQHQDAFENHMAEVPIGCLGTVTETPEFVISGLTGKRIVDTSIDNLKSAWQTPLHS